MIRHAYNSAKSGAISLRHAASKRAFKSFAESYNLVYFGSVSQHGDEHQLVRGVTLSAVHKDRHYCVGSIQNYDFILLERMDTLSSPGKKAVHYSWAIIQLDLHSIEPAFGHIFIKGNRYDEVFEETLFIKHRQLKQASPGYFGQYDSLFIDNFKVYADHEATINFPTIINPDIAATIAHHFRQYDFEIDDDKLYVYAKDPIITRLLLNDMARAGLWLAKHLDSL